MKRFAAAFLITLALSAAAHGQTATAPKDAAQDGATIRAAVKSIEGAWNSRDGKAFAAPFAVDADYVVVNGRHIKGRDVIEKEHVDLFSTLYKESRNAATVKSVRLIRPDVAVAHVEWNLEFKAGGEARKARAINTMVFTKEGGRWSISAFQNTPVQPNAGPPPPRQPAPERGSVLRLPDGQLYYEVSGGGEPVVLLHGGGLDHHSWDKQVEPLARHFKVIRYDLRGHGRSSALESAPRHAEDLKGILDHLGIRKATLIGHSMGAGAAFDFTLRYPERVEKLVLVSTSKPPPHAPRVAGSFAPADPEGQERLKATGVPVLFVVGEHDSPQVRETADRAAGVIAGARKVVISGAKHSPHAESPEAFARELLSFLR